jgi:hypothetical protein
MTLKRILATLAVLGALAGGTAAATTSTAHAATGTSSSPQTFYRG